MPSTTIDKPVTDKQRAFLARLYADRPNEPRLDHDVTLSSTAASAEIGRLLAIPRPRPLAALDPDRVQDVGMYRTPDGTIYKVQMGQLGFYAKRLTPIRGSRLNEAGDPVQFEFVYDKGAVRQLRQSMRLSLEEAKAFGLRYGVCCVCGATLVDAKSVAAGIGPVCAKRV